MNSSPDEPWVVSFNLQRLVRRAARFDAGAYRQIVESHARPRPPTPQQLVLLDLIRRGLGNREIADRMGIKASTVGNNIHALKVRLRVNNRTELIKLATALRPEN